MAEPATSGLSPRGPELAPVPIPPRPPPPVPSLNLLKVREVVLDEASESLAA